MFVERINNSVHLIGITEEAAKKTLTGFLSMNPCPP